MPLIPVKMSNDEVIMVEMEVTDAIPKSAIVDALSFGPVKQQLQGLMGDLKAAVDKVKPDKIEIEFGLDISFQEGKLTSILLRGETTANFKIKVSWEGNSSSVVKSVSKDE